MTGNTQSSCNRPLSRAARQLFRRDASHILLHYFGSSPNAAWRGKSPSSGSVTTSVIDSANRDRDQRGIKRQRIPLVDHQEDGLSDDEWFQLLAYATLDNSDSENHINSNDHVCPLHPKHDVFLNDDQNSFLIQRRYRVGTKNFGALSLPLLGRAARTFLWLDERDIYHQKVTSSSLYDFGRSAATTTTEKRYMGNAVHLFQCGYCEKTFLSRYYLDRHFDLHHRHLSDAATSNGGNSVSDEEQASLICPADHLCDPLGGISACVETMNQISPYWGRGTMLGKEYIDSTRESLFSSSIHSLLEHFHLGNAGDDEQTTENKMPQKNTERVREGDLTNIVGEIRHRSIMRSKLLMQTLLIEKQHNQQQEVGDVHSDLSFDIHDNLQEQSDIQDDSYHLSTLACDNEEMERLYNLCEGMMTTCFGKDESPNSKGQHVNLVHDLIEQICQPLHCHYRLHRMAGHTARHVLMWNNEWEEHHSYSLGLFGWLVILGLLIFYACAFMLGFGSDVNWGSNLLPSYRLARQKKKSS
jgi:hypothetical protein